MIRNVKRAYFEVWGSEEAQNVFLKGIVVFSFFLILTQSIVLCILAMQKPTLIGIGEMQSEVLKITPPSDSLLKSELSRVLRKYTEAHYNFDYQSIEKSFDEASHYISEPLKKEFLSSNQEQIKFSKEKKASQKVYHSRPIQIDEKRLLAAITLDRVFTVEGIRATAPLTLEIKFEYGSRTIENPEGLYIVSEKLIQESRKE